MRKESRKTTELKHRIVTEILWNKTKKNPFCRCEKSANSSSKMLIHQYTAHNQQNVPKPPLQARQLFHQYRLQTKQEKKLGPGSFRTTARLR